MKKILDWFRRKWTSAPPASVQVPGSKPPAAAPHQSWVKTPLGVGWIHHHESSGWYVEYPNGLVIEHPFQHVENIAPPAAP